METQNIKNGVDLHIISAPKFKTNAISVYFNIPFARSTVTKAALLPAVLKRGCIKYPTLKDFSIRLDEMFSASLEAGCRQKGDGEVIYITAEYISDKFAGEELSRSIAEFLRDFIFAPLAENGGFLKKYVDGEKVNLKNDIVGLINDKKEYAEFRCREEMFGKDGCGMSELGYIEDLDGITPQSLYEFYQKLILSAKVDIFVSGTADEKTLKNVKTVLCGAFVPRNAAFVVSNIANYRCGDIRKVTEEADTVQSKLCMGLICKTEPSGDDYYALLLANCIFGASPFSKLFNNVREKLSLAYYVISKVTRLKSFMLISSGIQTENFDAAYNEIMLQLEKMQNGEIEDAEISAAKKYMQNAFTSIGDSIKSTEDFYLGQAILGSDDGIDKFIDGITAVTKEKLCEAMKRVKLDTVYFLKGKTEV